MPEKNKDKVILTLRKTEQRAEEKDGTKYIYGFIPYGKSSCNLSWFGEEYEILQRGCFKKTLNDRAEVRAFHNHNDSEVLGNTKSGTLELEDSEEGLKCMCKIPNTTYANDLYEVINRGDCRTMSFGMYINKYSLEERENGSVIRTITEAALDEVSFGVAYPAYSDTDSSTDTRSIITEFKVSELTAKQKDKILKIAEEIRSSSEPAESTPMEPAESTPPATDDGNAERELKDKANAIADAFIFQNK